jgi:hypothetical protein
MIELFETGAWQMTAGERAAFEGILGQLKPALAVEIGTAEGGSLKHIAAHAGEVHSFDLVEPEAEVAAIENVTLHTGDSHALLPQTLAEFAQQGRNVDFVLVDGDHTTEGACQDLADLLDSDAIQRTVIMLHDTANPEVRTGLEAARAGERAKVRVVDLDFVPGYLVKAERFHHECWGGLGLIVVDDSAEMDPPHVVSAIAYPQPEVLASHWQSLSGAAVHDDLERRLAVITNSRSWRATAPFRRAAERLRSRLPGQ